MTTLCFQRWARDDDDDGDRGSARAGFSLLEILVAVGLLSVVGLVALHSRSVMIRAEQKAYRLEQARFLMRDLVARHGAGKPLEDIVETLPAGWQWAETLAFAEMTDASGTYPLAPWSVWRLTHEASETVLEVAVGPVSDPPETRDRAP